MQRQRLGAHIITLTANKIVGRGRLNKTAHWWDPAGDKYKLQL